MEQNYSLHRMEIDEYNTKIQELNKKLATLEVELQIIRSNTAKKEDE